MNISEKHQPLAAQLQAFRHELHRHPELSNQEFETTARLRAALEEHQIRILDLPLPTGLVAEVGHGDGPLIVLRSDIDALPIEEKSGVEYLSQNPGVMHACGHDFHASTALGAAILLKKIEASLPGRVRILFQAAEETGMGAPALLATGALDQAKAIFGIHNDPSLPVGVIGSKGGALTAGVDRFTLTITGTGSHAAKPHEGNDPIVIAGQLIGTLQTVISRNLSSAENAVVSITQIHSGTTWNVIPDSAWLEGTVRTFSAGAREKIEQRFRQVAQGLSETYAARIELDWQAGPPSVVNDPAWAEFALAQAPLAGFAARVVEASPIGEDFAFYQQQIPGAFVMVGSGGPFALHHPEFRVDDRALFPTADYLATLAVNALEKQPDPPGNARIRSIAMNQAVTLPAALLMRQAETILTGWGMPEDIALQTAELMVETDLFGVDSHGISMLPHYDKLLQAGLWNPAGRAKIIRETPATAVIDGCHSLGHATALLAIQTAVAKSELSGMGSVVVRHSNHFGAAGLYARYAAARGKIALITSTTRSRMLVPSRAQVPVLGTNPLAFAAPAERNADFVLDMATTTVAANKVKVYDFTGQALPPGWVSDEHGEAVTDSALGMEYVFQRPPGGLTPLGGLEETGGHKGYGLAMLAQILAGPLAGASFAATRPAGGMPDIGHFFLVIDPAAFGDPSDFRQGLDHIIDTLHDTPPADASKPVLVAGDIENQTHQQRSLSGIPLPAALIAQLQALCQRSGFTDLLAAHLPPSSS